MRRMLDPKEVGGGRITLYRHSIRIIGENRSEACFEVYSQTEEKFKVSTFKEYIRDKQFACSGMVKHNNQWLPIDLIWGFMGSIYCRWLDLTNGNANSESFIIVKIQDDVVPVD